MTRPKRGAAIAAAAAIAGGEESAAAATANKRVKTEESEEPTPAAAVLDPVPDGQGQPKEDDISAIAMEEEQKEEEKEGKNEQQPAPTTKQQQGKSKSSIRSQALQQQQNFNTEQLMANFDHYLFQLLAFKVETGNFHVPKDHELHHWLQFLKKEFKNHCNTQSLLSDAQVKVLEFLHVPLTSRGDEHWNRFYELLKQYEQRHGHVLVPRLCEVPGLGDWVTDQRRQYKSYKQGQISQLTQERREKLEQLGFAWQVRNRPEWDMRFQQLLEYRDKHGDCKVPQHYKENKALGKWTAKQREQYKLMKKGLHSFLTPYRLEKLNQIGFVWQVRTSIENEDLEEGDKEIKDEDDKKEPAMKNPPPPPPMEFASDNNQTVEELVAEAAAAVTAGMEMKPNDDVAAV